MNHKIAAFIEAMLQNNAKSEALLVEAENEPSEPLLQCYAASLHLYAQTDEDTAKATTLLSRTKKHAEKLSPTETLMFQAIQAWNQQNHLRALDLFKHVLTVNPEYLLALKYAEWLFYVIGQAFYAEQFLQLCESIAHHHRQNPYFLSIYAFALELAGKQNDALLVANQALVLNPTLAWAQHAIAHTQLMQGNIQASITTLQTYQNDWGILTPTLQSHLYWHLALLHIAKRQESSAMNLFHQHIWSKSTPQNTVLVQQDTISFLCRMELAGMPQSHLWTEVIREITPVMTNLYMPFNNLHYLYACGKGQRDDLANALLNKVILHAKQQVGPAQVAWQTVGLPALRGIYAFSLLEYQQSVDVFKPILSQIGCVGGSDAEIELFHMIYCFALLKCNETNQAKMHFETHLMHYHKTPLHAYWFST